MKKQFILAVIMMFNVVFGITLTTSLLSLYLNKIGISLSSIGMIFAVGAIAAGFLRLLIGAATDHFGRKKFVFCGIAGYVLFALGLVLAGEFFHFVALNLLLEISGAIFWTAFSAYFFDLLKKGKEGIEIGERNAILYGSATLAPLVAGLIVRFADFNALFLASAGIVLLALLPAIRIKETIKAKSADIFDFRREYNDILNIKGFKTIFIIIFLSNFVWTFWYIYMPIYLNNAGIATDKIGILLSTMTGIGALMQHPMGKKIDKLPAKWILIPGFFAFWLGGIMFFMFKNFYWYLLSRTVLGIGSDATYWPAVGIFARITPKREHGGGWAVLMTGAAFAYGIGALLGGWLTERFTIELVLKGAAFMALAITLIIIPNKFLATKGVKELKRHQILHLNHRHGVHK